MSYAVGVGGLLLALAILAFIVWRYTSVARGARRRDKALLAILDPYAQRFEAKQTVAAEEIRELADRPQLRPMLYSLLQQYQRLDLFPADYLTEEKQAEGRLAYWMMHPNEEGAAPEEIEVVATVRRRFEEGEGAFHVLKYRMPEGHWACKDGWLVGLAGPYFEGDPPHVNCATAFSRCSDKYGETDPEELVDWYMGIQAQKST